MKNIKEAYASMIAAHPHEIFVTLHFENARVSDEQARKCCLEFVRNVGKSYRTVAAGWGVFNRLHHPHCHLVLFGKTRSVRSLQTSDAERMWRYGSAFVSPYEDRGACDYLARNMTLNAPEKYDLMPFGLRILKKRRVQTCSQE